MEWNLDKRSHFELLSYSQGVVRAGSAASFDSDSDSDLLIWQIFAPVALPNTISKGYMYMSLSGNKSGIIHLLS